MYKSLTKRIIFAPDTNLLYHAFLSKLRGLEGIQIAIVDLVKKEIENSMNFKYKPTHLKELRKVLHNQNKKLLQLSKKVYLYEKSFRIQKSFPD